MSNSLGKLLSFLNQLDDANIAYYIEHPRDETLMVNISADNERWEVEFYADGDIEVEVFYGEGPDVELEGEEALARLFENNDDD